VGTQKPFTLRANFSEATTAQPLWPKATSLVLIRDNRKYILTIAYPVDKIAGYAAGKRESS
jgi:hypothetical protein